MNTPEQAIRLLKKRDVAAAAEVIHRAFEQEKAIGYIFAGSRAKKRGKLWLYRLFIDECLRNGEAWTTAHGEGVALWFYPRPPETTWRTFLTPGFLAMPFVIGLPAFVRLMDMLRIANAAHEKYMKGDHWYLQILGVDPPCQGKGIGTSLLRPILDRADDSGVPCYLETANERSLPFYEKSGFHRVEEFRLTKGIPVWILIRRPAPKKPDDTA